MFILGTGEFLDSALSKGLGGVIFFTRDIKTKEQFKNLIKDIKNKSLIPPFLSIDQEGGRVERTENIHPRYLSPREAYFKGIEYLKNQTEKISYELNDYGINLNFAPCADVNTNPNNPIIGDRAFSDKTDDVIKGVKIVSEEYRKNGIIPCVKHFPGHGDADKDSHLELPKIDLSLSEIAESREISRAAVEDAVKKSCQKLDECEAKLHLQDKNERLLKITQKLKDKGLNDSEIKEIEDIEKELDYGI